MVKLSNASYENEIHRVDSPFNEDSKNTLREKLNVFVPSGFENEK